MFEAVVNILAMFGLMVIVSIAYLKIKGKLEISHISTKPKTATYDVPPEHVGELLELHYEIDSLNRALTSSYGIESKEHWRALLVEKELFYFSKIETLARLFGNAAEHFQDYSDPPTPSINFNTNKITVYLENRK